VTNIYASIRAFLREWKRRRWLRARRASIRTPFD
jgi:hypothetical protein